MASTWAWPAAPALDRRTPAYVRNIGPHPRFLSDAPLAMHGGITARALTWPGNPKPEPLPPMHVPARPSRPALVAVALVLAAVLLPAHGAAPLDTGNGGTTGYTTLDVTLLLVYLLGALVLSFLCSVAEATLLSITPSYIQGLRETRPQLAETLQRLRQDNVDQSLAAILTLNTIAHTAGAIGSGAKATVVFGSAWVGVFSAVATLLILFLSEIVPKTLGAVYWRSLAGPTARFVRALIVMLYPLIKMSELLTRLVSRGKKVHVFSRDEFVAMADVGEEAGQIDERESRIIRNLFRMTALKARDAMTPRTVVKAIPGDRTVGDTLEDSGDTPFSRLPVYGTDLDDVHGFILKDDLLLAHARGENSRLVSELQRELPAIPGSQPLSTVLERLLERRHQITLVVGEYGETLGLLTLEDLIETLLGDEIVDEQDTVEDMRALARERWERRAKRRGVESAAWTRDQPPPDRR